MVRSRVLVLAVAGIAISGCSSPVPDYVSVKQPAPYRTAPDGLRVDNENYALDAEGYRLDKRGQRIGAVDIQAKMDNEPSNAVAGFYISSTGANAPGRVMAPSEGAAAGAGYGPGSAGMMSGGTAPTPSTPPPPASGAPVPLAPATK